MHGFIRKIMNRTGGEWPEERKRADSGQKPRASRGVIIRR
ncbi:hypothetical protein HMPREF3041_02854 [Escherichia coli]|uniref:Uncharacterized protein n=1 Tax=Shigella dysenteriae 1 TaxID=984897 RepID=A0A142CNQ6_SHIDY|nr:hypothetical protein [Shigella dysenteriae 1]AVE23174.1 hypothetical protein [Escherichia coli]AMQ12351.1 hypothetical protein [Shigella dysenteriae 1]AWF76268.1 hypothetical protein [Escherichia coli]KXG94617.1 hypothetical protein HMPREF3041_02854 [Escherichia coli]